MHSCIEQEKQNDVEISEQGMPVKKITTAC